MDRLMIFIDGSNLYKSLEAKYGRRPLNFKRFIEKLSQTKLECRLFRTYYYNVRLKESVDSLSFKAQNRFFHSLKATIDNLEISLGNLQKTPSGDYIEKGVDILLAKDMLTKAFKNHYDVAILVSADGDYASVVQEIKDTGKHVEVAIVDGVSAYALRQTADKIILLTDEFLNDCWLE